MLFDIETYVAKRLAWSLRIVRVSLIGSLKSSFASYRNRILIAIDSLEAEYAIFSIPMTLNNGALSAT